MGRYLGLDVGTTTITALALADELGAGGRVCKPRAGYMGTTLFWMAASGVLPRAPFTASFLPDYVVAALTGTRPATDATDAAGSGLFDVFSLKWEEGLIGAGNGIRKNSLLREILSGAFGMRMRTPAHQEEAAFGAALLAAVGDGAFRDIQEAGRVIRYEH